ncbi:hypothetical protein PRJ_Fausto_00242 [Faustovirus]|nr:hypothetical protein PRJ_Fausto_00242 [Faustovirus]AMN84164.1 hypothetical protein D5a_00256 [Faustovirus]
MSVTVVVNEAYVVVQLDTIESITDIDLLFALSAAGHLQNGNYPVANRRLDDYIFEQTNSENYWDDAEITPINFNDLESDDEGVMPPRAYCEDPKGVTYAMDMICMDLVTKLGLNVDFNATHVKIVFISDVEHINRNIKTITGALGFNKWRRFDREIVRSCLDYYDNTIYYRCKMENYYTDSEPIDREEDNMDWREVETTIVLSITPFVPSLQFAAYTQLLKEKWMLSEDQKTSMQHLKKLSGSSDFSDAVKYLKINSMDMSEITVY